MTTLRVVGSVWGAKTAILRERSFNFSVFCELAPLVLFLQGLEGGLGGGGGALARAWPTLGPVAPLLGLPFILKVTPFAWEGSQILKIISLIEKNGLRKRALAKRCFARQGSLQMASGLVTIVAFGAHLRPHNGDITWEVHQFIAFRRMVFWLVQTMQNQGGGPLLGPWRPFWASFFS